MNESTTIEEFFFHAAVVYCMRRQWQQHRLYWLLSCVSKRGAVLCSHVSRGSGIRQKTMEAYESEHCGWFHEGSKVDETMWATCGWESHLSAFLCRHCVTVYIDTEIEKREEKSRKGWHKSGKERKGKREMVEWIRFITVLACCHGSADVFFQSFFTFATRHENGCTTLHDAPDTRRRGSASLLSVSAVSFMYFHATVSHDNVVVNF